MAVYPTRWQVECDMCGNVNNGGPGVSAQEVLAVALQHGWALQVQPPERIPTVLLRCSICTTLLFSETLVGTGRTGVTRTRQMLWLTLILLAVIIIAALLAG